MKIQEFVKEYEDGTQRGYISAIYLFLDHIYKRPAHKGYPTPEDRQEYERLADKYFSENRNAYQDIVSFLTSMHTHAPKTIRTYVGNARSFLVCYNDRKFTEDENRKLKLKMRKIGKGAVTQDLPLTHEIIRQILSHSDIKGRAAIYLLATTGMRIGELCSFIFSDLNLKERSIRLRAENTKTGEQRFVYFTLEALEALNEYLAIRDKLIAEGNNHAASFGHTVTDTGRVFPFTEKSFRASLARSAANARLLQKDAVTVRNNISPHAFRRFFNSTLKIGGMPDALVEALLGHSTALSKAYFRSPETSKLYQQYSHLLILTKDESILEDIMMLKQENRELTNKVSELTKISKMFFEMMDEKYKIPRDHGGPRILKTS